MGLGEGGEMELSLRFFSRPFLIPVYCQLLIVEGSERFAILIIVIGTRWAGSVFATLEDRHGNEDFLQEGLMLLVRNEMN